MLNKTCSKCGSSKLIHANFYHSSKSTDGYRSECKLCTRKKKALPTRLSKFLFITDTHVPEHDPVMWRLMLQFIDDEVPDEIIIMGDFAELAAFSMHGNDAVLKHWTEEKKAVVAKLAELRYHVPLAKIVYLEGNHETRVTRWCSKYAPQLTEELSLPNAFKLKDLGVIWVPEDEQPIEIGNLLVLHGHQMGMGKMQILPELHTKKAVDLYGSPGQQIIYGHTHKYQIYEKQMFGGNARAIGLGCGRELKVTWSRGVNGWVHQLALGYLDEDDDMTIYPIDIKKGKLIWNGKRYV